VRVGVGSGVGVTNREATKGEAALARMTAATIRARTKSETTAQAVRSAWTSLREPESPAVIEGLEVGLIGCESLLYACLAVPARAAGRGERFASFEMLGLKACLRRTLLPSARISMSVLPRRSHSPAF
jgi:hypothetical protein